MNAELTPRLQGAVRCLLSRPAPGFCLILVVACAIAGLWTRAAERESPALGVLPVGSIIAFGGPASAIPESGGWLLCDGRELSAQAYGSLHAVLGSAWGGSPNGATFRLPDLRGRFLRGVNASASGEGRDPEAGSRLPSAPGGNGGDDVGSAQTDAVGPHEHALVGVGDAAGPGGDEGWVRLFAVKIPNPEAPVVTTRTAIQPGTGIETRPSNLAVHWMIRAR